MTSGEVVPSNTPSMAEPLMFFKPKPLRTVFSVVVLIMAVEMTYKGLVRW